MHAQCLLFAAMNEADALALVDEVEAAWNTHDMKRFAACFAADADFVNVAGVWLRGRDEIEHKHAASHAGRFKNSTMRLQVAAAKEIDPGIGVLHVTWQLDGHSESGPRKTADTRRGIFSWTVRERSGQLEIVSSHNTDVLNPASDNAVAPTQ
jgi:uncharacterized protein (TIGR02246 family)